MPKNDDDIAVVIDLLASILEELKTINVNLEKISVSYL
jgi:hypothetical protein